MNNKKTTKVVDSVNNIINRTPLSGFSNCGKTYLLNPILLQKQEPILIITKSLNQNLIINAQTSDEIEPLEIYENRAVVFDDMLLAEQERNIDLFFTQGRHYNFDVYYIYLSYFHFPKNTIRIKSNKFIYLNKL